MPWSCPTFSSVPAHSTPVNGDCRLLVLHLGLQSWTQPPHCKSGSCSRSDIWRRSWSMKPQGFPLCVWVTNLNKAATTTTKKKTKKKPSLVFVVFNAILLYTELRTFYCVRKQLVWQINVLSGGLALPQWRLYWKPNGPDGRGNDSYLDTQHFSIRLEGSPKESTHSLLFCWCRMLQSPASALSLLIDDCGGAEI